jgi:hypothetical protein
MKLKAFLEEIHWHSKEKFELSIEMDQVSQWGSDELTKNLSADEFARIV